jgi:hypothetical protein
LAMDFNISIFHSRDPLKMIDNVCSILCDEYDDEGVLTGLRSPVVFSSIGAPTPINVSDLYGLGCAAER